MPMKLATTINHPNVRELGNFIVDGKEFKSFGTKVNYPITE